MACARRVWLLALLVGCDALSAGGSLPVGAVRAGAVTRVESYGCFVKLDACGASGLVHVSELAPARVRHPENVVAVGQPVLVKVLAPKEGKTSFSLKAVDQRTGAAAAPPPPPRPRAATTAKVTLDECTVKYIRASGAGGQNVNKVSTKAELRFDVDRSSLPPAVKTQLRTTHASRLTKAGELIVVSETHQTQRLNAADALKRLQGFVDAAAAAAAPRATAPDRARRVKKLARGSERKRKDGKQKASAKKASRRRPIGDD
jgi:predicted RNA-binding protein with RPS1 domain